MTSLDDMKRELRQKFELLKGKRCPHFKAEQLKLMFEAIDTTLKGGPETGCLIKGDEKNPELEIFCVGEDCSIRLKDRWRFFGTFHTHPPPENGKERLKPSGTDIVNSFRQENKLVCVGGRDSKKLDGEPVIRCYFLPTEKYVKQRAWKEVDELEKLWVCCIDPRCTGDPELDGWKEEELSPDRAKRHRELKQKQYEDYGKKTDEIVRILTIEQPDCEWKELGPAPTSSHEKS